MRIPICVLLGATLWLALPQATNARSRLSKRARKAHVKAMDRLYVKWRDVGTRMSREWERPRLPTRGLALRLKAFRAKLAYLQRKRRSLARGGCRLAPIQRVGKKMLGRMERLFFAMKRGQHKRIPGARKRWYHAQGMYNVVGGFEQMKSHTSVKRVCPKLRPAVCKLLHLDVTAFYAAKSVQQFLDHLVVCYNTLAGKRTVRRTGRRGGRTTRRGGRTTRRRPPPCPWGRYKNALHRCSRLRRGRIKCTKSVRATYPQCRR